MSDEPKIKINPVEYMQRLRKIDNYEMNEFLSRTGRHGKRERRIKKEKSWGGRTLVMNSRLAGGAGVEIVNDDQQEIERIMREMRIQSND